MFYVTLLCVQVRNEKQVAILVKVSEPSSKHFLVFRPNTGLQAKTEKLSDLTKKYIKVGEGWREKKGRNVFINGRCSFEVGGKNKQV